MGWDDTRGCRNVSGDAGVPVHMDGLWICQLAQCSSIYLYVHELVSTNGPCQL